MSALHVIEAEVQVGAETTRYLRCGRGPRAVVVLAEEPVERDRLMQRFAEGHTVVAPVRTVCATTDRSDTSALEEWLDGVIDGLGLNRPTVALAPGLAWLAERLVTRSGERVDVVMAVAAG